LPAVVGWLLAGTMTVADRALIVTDAAAKSVRPWRRGSCRIGAVSDGGADLPQRGQVGDLESVYEVVANSCHIVRCGGGDLGVV